VAAAVEKAKQARAAADAQETLEKRRVQQLRAARRQAASAEVALVAKSASQAFPRYLHVREEVRRLCAAVPATDGMTASEQRMLVALEPLWDATPEMITGLRRQATAISGVRASDYADDVNRSMRIGFQRDLRRLLTRGDSTL
jgi:hypothetical protein